MEMFESIYFGIFTFQPQITGLGIELVCSAIILAVAAEIIYFIYINPDFGSALIGLFIFLIFFSLLIGIFVILGKKYSGFKRFIAGPVDIVSYTYNLIIILLIAIAVTAIPILIAFYIWEDDPINNMVVNIAITLILSAIAYWGLRYSFKELLALNSFSKWKKSRPTPETHIICPDCRKFIIKEARKCTHCNCNLIPQP